MENSEKIVTLDQASHPEEREPEFDRELTFDDLAKEVGVTTRTISEWASKRRHISRRLRVIRYSHKTVKVRWADWMKFKEAMSK